MCNEVRIRNSAEIFLVLTELSKITKKISAEFLSLIYYTMNPESNIFSPMYVYFYFLLLHTYFAFIPLTFYYFGEIYSVLTSTTDVCPISYLIILFLFYANSFKSIYRSFRIFNGSL